MLDEVHERTINTDFGAAAQSAASSARPASDRELRDRRGARVRALLRDSCESAGGPRARRLAGGPARVRDARRRGPAARD